MSVESTTPASTGASHAAEPRDWDPAAPAKRRSERRLLAASRPLAWFLLHAIVRNRRDVVHIPRLGYVITGAVACREAAVDSEHFRKDGPKSAGALLTQVMGKTALLNMEGPDHVALRRRLQGLFTPKFVNELADRALAPISAEVVADLQAGKTLDVSLLARRVTGTMMCHMVGLRLEGEAREKRAREMYKLGQRLVGMVPTNMKELDEREVAAAKAVFEQLVDGIDEVHADGDENTIPGRLRELGFDLEETRGVVGMLLIAGTETTSTALVRITSLLYDTSQWKRLQRHRELLDNAIEEGLRCATPVPVSTRTSAKDFTFHGTKIRKDELVLIAWARAIRDDRVIERGTEFDIAREIPRELRLIWFGAGPHFCLGYNLAMRELTTVLTALLDGAPEIEITKRKAARKVLLPTWDELYVRRAGGAATSHAPAGASA
ncbi:MAG: Cytochrome [Thermoleophilia bacterium]|nr:Cytochrome [Thermoleophilia bacterium]